MLADKMRTMELAANYQSPIPASKSYNYVYPYTTENIGEYMPVVKGKSILSVIGSGDHYLNFVSEGAKKVDSFDINRLSLFYLKLKKAAALGLSLEEFHLFLEKDATSYYEKVKPHLTKAGKDYWNYYVLYFMKYCGITASNVFFSRVLQDQYERFNPYLSIKGYQSLQRNLPNHKNEKCYRCDVLDLPKKIKEKYDYIFLSNIHSYQFNISKFQNAVYRLHKEALNPNGAIYYAYCYHSDEEEDVFLKESMNMGPKMETIEVSPSFPYQLGKDKVLILHK